MREGEPSSLRIERGTHRLIIPNQEPVKLRVNRATGRVEGAFDLVESTSGEAFLGNVRRTPFIEDPFTGDMAAK